MTLTDSGPLVAIIDRHDTYHAICNRTLAIVRVPLLTTIAVLTESMYFLGTRIGWNAQQTLWTMLNKGRISIALLEPERLVRMEELMAKYADTPMDFADASLVAVAEETGLSRIFSLDDHFKVYRIRGREPFDIIPSAE